MVVLDVGFRDLWFWVACVWGLCFGFTVVDVLRFSWSWVNDFILCIVTFFGLLFKVFCT